MDFFLSKKNRLLKTREFRYTEKMGCSKKSPHFVLLFNSNQLNDSRIGLTVSRKNGNAVKRNYIKRFIREFYRIRKQNFPCCDYVLIVRKTFDKNNSKLIKKELDELFSIE